MMTICGIPFRHASGTGYQPAGAIWLDGSADYLSRTFGGAGDNKTGTISLWVKRAEADTDQQLFHARSGSGSSQIRFQADNALYFRLEESSGALAGLLTTTPIYRDSSAWMHIVCNFLHNNLVVGI